MYRRTVLMVLAGLVAMGLVGAGVALAGGPDLGRPAFPAVSSPTMILKYGFRGAAVYDKALKRWSVHRMTTITRRKVAGYVNQVNRNLALAAGLHEVAVYDYRKHAWQVYRPAPVDDSTRNLRRNLVLTPTYAKVKLLNGPFLVYRNGRWSKVRR